jgi:hypothetical protein
MQLGLEMSDVFQKHILIDFITAIPGVDVNQTALDKAGRKFLLGFCHRHGVG